MEDISALRARIEQAAEGLDSAEDMRRNRNETLGDTLAKVEERFSARGMELGYLRERIGELETANDGLAATIEEFSVLIREESEDQVESALFRASAGARELLAAIDDGRLSPRLPAPTQRFENLTQAELDAEGLAAPPAGDIDIPEIEPLDALPEPDTNSLPQFMARLQRRHAA